MQKTKYYDEFLRYHEMAKWQQENCNLNGVAYDDTPYEDDLIKNVHIYDVVERKYAGFTQFLLDLWYSKENKKDHPYLYKLAPGRDELIDSYWYTNKWDLVEWLFVFFVHRLTGSGINYAVKNSGYYNSVLHSFKKCYTIRNMVEAYKHHNGPKFTSKGYQIAPFPKPIGNYGTGGAYFICEVLPNLIYDFADFLTKNKLTFREAMSFLETFNKSKGFRVFRFQYAAVLADIADFFPELLDRTSHFFYGSNAKECLKYLFEKPKGNELEFLDKVTEQILKDTSSLPYNSEDIACDFIRWVENYIDPRGDYSHLDLDQIWSSSEIKDHPFGRQKAMLDLGLVKTFNGEIHPHDDKILKLNNLTINEYKDKINAKR